MIHLIVSIAHVIGVAVGVGGATATDPLFLSSIRNRKITSDQLVLLHVVSRLVMAGLALLILSGIGHVLLHPAVLYDSGFLAKMTIVTIIAANGFVFHGRVLPKLEKCVDRRMGKEMLAENLPLMTISGALSGASWYSALILGVILPATVPYWLAINLYLLIVLGGIVAAYLVLSHLIFTPQPEPEEVLEKERFPQAMRWTPAVLAVIVLGVITVSLLGIGTP